MKCNCKHVCAQTESASGNASRSAATLQRVDCAECTLTLKAYIAKGIARIC